VIPRVTTLLRRLAARGLETLSVSDSQAVLARPETPREQIARWGGEVEIAVSGLRTLVTITAADHREILSELLAELHAQGIATEVDEP
jgi:hypothetical protein